MGSSRKNNNLLLLLAQDVGDRGPDELRGLRSIDGLPDAGLSVVVDDGAGLLQRKKREGEGTKASRKVDRARLAFSREGRVGRSDRRRAVREGLAQLGGQGEGRKAGRWPRGIPASHTRDNEEHVPGGKWSTACGGSRRCRPNAGSEARQ
jgi:hypothetical protein